MTRVVAPALKAEVARLAADLVAWRRDLHRHPELAFEEHRTAGVVAAHLGALGLELRTGIAGTGVLGLLRAPHPTGPAVLLRADMDALPIDEVGGREYGSTVPGRMHACGHDGHVAMLLGAAATLARHRASLPCDVVFCFQPAEEGFGGAERMIAEGALDWVDVGSVFALHLWTPYARGTVHARGGAIMAAADEFSARIVGRGGHGAQPHLAADPVVAAALGITALQAVVARAIDPLEAAVVTVGSLHAGSAPNVIPHEARLAGTLRSFDPGVRALLRERVPAALESAARAATCTLEFELKPGYPATVNDAAAAARARRLAAEVVGAAQVHESPPLTAAEDFAYLLARRPGAFILLGAGDPGRGLTAPHHSPGFDIDETVLPLGTELLARLALAESSDSSGDSP
jgi:amidohydrolase